MDTYTPGIKLKNKYIKNCIVTSIVNNQEMYNQETSVKPSAWQLKAGNLQNNSLKMIEM